MSSSEPRDNPGSTPSFWRAAGPIMLRGVLYIALVALLMVPVMEDAKQPGIVGFTEESYTEVLESLLLAFCAAIMLLARRYAPSLATCNLLLFGFFFASLIREQDALFDLFIADGGWQVGVTLTLIPVLFFAFRERHRLPGELVQLRQSFAFGLLLAGVLTTYVFARLYGRRIFWEAVMGDGYLRWVKDAAEEVTELFGYLLLAIAAVELLLLAVQLGRRTEQPTDATLGDSPNSAVRTR
ncbi:MAG: hypothetical protein AAGA23_11985 [Pseudomonadota bacterium]